MRYSENFQSLLNFHSNSAHAKFLHKGRSLKGYPTCLFAQGILLESQPVLSGIKAHDLAPVLQNLWGFGPFHLPWEHWKNHEVLTSSSFSKSREPKFLLEELRGKTLPRT